jgi:DNA-3-methyladenine glycosylase I
MTYCKAILQMSGDKKTLHQAYHDHSYGFPIDDDNELFCRLILEINQAGLSWETILKKEKDFRRAYDGFEIKKIAAYKDIDVQRLLCDSGIIRNRLKVNAAIHNANAVLSIQKEFGSFVKWLDHHHPKSKDTWVKLFKKTFKFTGGEIVNEFLMSIGILPHAHDKECYVYNQVILAKPKWLDKVIGQE